MKENRTIASLPGRWWSGRSVRERLLLGGLLAAATAYLVVVGAAQPMLAARDEAVASIARSDAALARLAALPEPGDRQEDGASDIPVTVVVTRTANELGLTIRRIEPEGAGARLSIENADFNAVVTWIAELEIENGLRVVAVEMDRRPDPGIVNATLSVQR